MNVDSTEKIPKKCQSLSCSSKVDRWQNSLKVFKRLFIAMSNRTLNIVEFFELIIKDQGMLTNANAQKKTDELKSFENWNQSKNETKKTYGDGRKNELRNEEKLRIKQNRIEEKRPTGRRLRLENLRSRANRIESIRTTRRRKKIISEVERRIDGAASKLKATKEETRNRSNFLTAKRKQTWIWIESSAFSNGDGEKFR